MRLLRLRIRNFKAIDGVDIEFPPPRMPNDPDAFIMGSRNGLGETSVLEATAVFLLAAMVGTEVNVRRFRERVPIDIPDLLIRSGSEEAVIEGDVTVDDEPATIVVQLLRNGEIKVKGANHGSKRLRRRESSKSADPNETLIRFFGAVAGLHSSQSCSRHFYTFTVTVVSRKAVRNLE